MVSYVGYAHDAGYKAAGNADMLNMLGKQYGMDVSIVDLVESDCASTRQCAETVSSTKVCRRPCVGSVWPQVCP